MYPFTLSGRKPPSFTFHAFSKEIPIAPIGRVGTGYRYDGNGNNGYGNNNDRYGSYNGYR